MIPVRIANFNAYSADNRLIGVTGEITLPNLEEMTETVSGAGIYGEIDVATPGHFGSLNFEIPFRTLTEQAFALLRHDGKALTLRGASQFLDEKSGATEMRQLKIVLKGPAKGLDLGKLGVSQGTETKVTLEAWYIKIVMGDKVLLELDKLNAVYILDGKDMVSNLKKFM